jgi:hypothetical protein
MQHTRMITYPALFLSYCRLLFSAISIHIGFKSVITIAISFHYQKTSSNGFILLYYIYILPMSKHIRWGMAMLTWLLFILGARLSPSGPTLLCINLLMQCTRTITLSKVISSYCPLLLFHCFFLSRESVVIKIQFSSYFYAHGLNS